jgi:lipopolysaccharide export LptBFGC system permease protein LptF
VAGTDRVHHAQHTRFSGPAVTITTPDSLRLADLGPIARTSETARARPEALSTMALQQRIAQGSVLGHPSSGDRMVLHARLAYPWLNLIVALLAWAPVCSHRRLAPMRQLARAAGWIVVLWLLVASGWLMGTTGLLPPGVAAWTPVGMGALLATLSIWCCPAMREILEPEGRLC